MASSLAPGCCVLLGILKLGYGAHLLKHLQSSLIPLKLLLSLLAFICPQTAECSLNRNPNGLFLNLSNSYTFCLVQLNMLISLSDIPFHYLQFYIKMLARAGINFYSTLYSLNDLIKNNV